MLNTRQAAYGRFCASGHRPAILVAGLSDMSCSNVQAASPSLSEEEYDPESFPEGYPGIDAWDANVDVGHGEEGTAAEDVQKEGKQVCDCCKVSI